MMPPACQVEIHVGRLHTELDRLPLVFRRSPARGGQLAKNAKGGAVDCLDRPHVKLPRTSRGHLSFQIVTAEKPPSTTMFCPVTNELARGEASHTTAPASSYGSPKRAIGVWPMI